MWNPHGELKRADKMDKASNPNTADKTNIPLPTHYSIYQNNLVITHNGKTHYNQNNNFIKTNTLFTISALCSVVDS